MTIETFRIKMKELGYTDFEIEEKIQERAKATAERMHLPWEIDLVPKELPEVD